MKDKKLKNNPILITNALALCGVTVTFRIAVLLTKVINALYIFDSKFNINNATTLMHEVDSITEDELDIMRQDAIRDIIENTNI